MSCVVYDFVEDVVGPFWYVFSPFKHDFDMSTILSGNNLGECE